MKLFFIPHFSQYRVVSEVLSFFKSIKDGDTIDWLKDKLCSFDAFYRSVFLSLFLIANIVFSFYTSHFLFGNHDFSGIKHGVKMDFWNGRYTSTLALKLFGGNVSPVLNSFASIAAMVVSSMLLCAYFNLPKRRRYWLTAALLPIVLPYSLSWFYYAYLTFSHAMLPGMAIVALWLVRDRFNIERMFISIFLVWFTLGVYPSILSFFSLCIGTQFILDLLVCMNTRSFIQRYSRFAGSMLAGGGLFKITVLVLRLLGKMSPSLYNMDMPPLFELVSKIPKELLLSFKQFFHSTPYIPVGLKLSLLAIIIVAVCLTMKLVMIRFRHSRKEEEYNQGVRKRLLCRMLILVVGWLFMFFVTMLPDFLSKVEFAFVVRTAYFSLPFFSLIAVTIVFRFASKPIANAILSIVIAILWCSVISDLEIQKNWKIGFENELNAYSRVLSMIEQNVEVNDLEAPINYLQIGSLPSGRLPFCRPKITDEIDSLEFHSFEFNPDWSPRAGVVFDYLGTHLKFKYRGAFRVDTPVISKFFDMKSPRWLEFLRKARPYPAPSEQCLFVDIQSNSLVIVLNKQVLEQLKNECGLTNSITE